MKRLILAALLFVAGGSYSLVSFAASTPDFLTQTALNIYNEDDWNLFGAATQKALNTLPNGQKESWNNVASGHGGFVQPVDTINKDGQTCRNVTIGNIDQGRTDQYNYLFCKAGSQWKLMPTA